MPTTITINRAPVLTLWAAVVAERLGFTRDESLTLGRAVAGMNAQAKAVRLGIREPATAGERPRGKLEPESDRIELLGRSIPVLRTPKGVRASTAGKPDSAEAVERYLVSKFGRALPSARAAMTTLAGSYPPKELAAAAYALYERFRPQIPAGTRGWGAKGELDLAALKRLAATKPNSA